MATDVGPKSQGRGKLRSVLPMLLGRAADAVEPFVELAIRICGWSAILFVLAIFLFVVGQAVLVIHWPSALEPDKLLVIDPEQKFLVELDQEYKLVVGLDKPLLIKPDKLLMIDPDQQFEIEPEQLLVIETGKSLVVETGKPVVLEPDKLLAIKLGIEPGETLLIDGKQPFVIESGRRFEIEIEPDKPLLIAAGEPVLIENPDKTGPFERLLIPPEQRVSLWTNLNVWEFLTSPNWRPTSPVREQYGILALLAGTAAVTLVSMLLAVPMGLGAAVYISEFCSGRVRETLKIVIELLAAIPSVVWGFIGVVIIGPLIISTTGAPVGVCVLNASIILALMSVPVIVSVGEDALKAVPDSYREAAISLGASRWEVVYRVLFPAARNGLLAAVLLGVGRAIGETMAVLMATGHKAQIPHSLLDPARTLTATIASELGEAPSGTDHFRTLFVIGIVLFVLTFIVNLSADLIVKGIRGGQNE